MRPAARWLRVHVEVPDRPGLCGCAGAADLRWHQRDHEGGHHPVDWPGRTQVRRDLRESRTPAGPRPDTEESMESRTKFLLDESRIPRHWYNTQAHLPKPMAPVLHPGTMQPVGPDDLAPLFPMELIMQEVTTEREVEIPE